MKNFLFDVKVFVTIRLDAETEVEARAKLDDQLRNEEWTQDGEADLIEVDGESPDSINDLEMEAWELYCSETAGDMDTRDWWTDLTPEVQKVYLDKVSPSKEEEEATQAGLYQA